jgi:hypothetical protein
MKRQISFAEAESQGKKRVTRRQRFLTEMESVVPWPRLLAAIEPYYPKGERGRPPIGLERMLRIVIEAEVYLEPIGPILLLRLVFDDEREQDFGRQLRLRTYQRLDAVLLDAGGPEIHVDLVAGP